MIAAWFLATCGMEGSLEGVKQNSLVLGYSKILLIQNLLQSCFIIVQNTRSDEIKYTCFIIILLYGPLRSSLYIMFFIIIIYSSLRFPILTIKIL